MKSIPSIQRVKKNIIKFKEEFPILHRKTAIALNKTYKNREMIYDIKCPPGLKSPIYHCNPLRKYRVQRRQDNFFIIYLFLRETSFDSLMGNEKFKMR